MLDALTIIQLRTFLWVAKLQSFRRTAIILKTTQPAISTRIAKMEKILGCPLFERSTSGIRITSHGEALIPVVENILQTTDSLRTIVDEKDIKRQTLHIGMSEFAASPLFDRLRARITSTFPDIELLITVESSDILKEDLLAGNLDLFFQGDVTRGPGLVCHQYKAFPLKWFAAPEVAERIKKGDTLPKISDINLLGPARSSASYQQILQYLTREGIGERSLSSCSLLNIRRRLCLEGRGIGLFPAGYVNDHTVKGSLVPLDLGWEPSPLIYTVTYMPERLNTTVADILRFLKDYPWQGNDFP
ncbi:LysR family transcriptional regulator [Sneathiella chinensis]|uniref:LysR family transcriptional regulator n=1 Tax=Sneathiella chinensis TaxID=349750 RepID=A0ABQ5U730_9PROT|nr:LysR family transcriptional regulator [Sneathiella chinensis]GLQ07122.1 LysR family transcriptional regulator [Sneathiella chinensis]